jgi:hypothetical protein
MERGEGDAHENYGELVGTVEQAEQLRHEETSTSRPFSDCSTRSCCDMPGRSCWG